MAVTSALSRIDASTVFSTVLRATAPITAVVMARLPAVIDKPTPTATVSISAVECESTVRAPFESTLESLIDARVSLRISFWAMDTPMAALTPSNPPPDTLIDAPLALAKIVVSSSASTSTLPASLMLLP